MTLLEIIERALVNLGEDTDAETVEEYKQGFSIAGHVNSGYIQVCERDYRPCRVEQAELDEDGCFAPSDLAFAVIFIEGVYPAGKAGLAPPRAHHALPDSRIRAGREGGNRRRRVLGTCPPCWKTTGRARVPRAVSRLPGRLRGLPRAGRGIGVRQQRAQFFLQEFERKRRMIPTLRGGTGRDGPAPFATSTYRGRVRWETRRQYRIDRFMGLDQWRTRPTWPSDTPTRATSTPTAELRRWPGPFCLRYARAPGHTGAGGVRAFDAVFPLRPDRPDPPARAQARRARSPAACTCAATKAAGRS